MRRHRALAVLVGAALLSSCEKNAVQKLTGTPVAAAIKFYNFGVNAPGVNFYANDTKMTAITSGTGTESTTGTNYGNVAAGGFYSGIEAGQYTFSGRIAAATDKDLPISNISGSLEDGKYYSLYQSGFYDATAKSIDGFIVEDPIPAQIEYTVAYVRFVNAISNSSPMTLYAKFNADTTTTETALGGEVAYKSAGAFTALPGGTYNLATRVAGSSTNAISRAAVSFSAGRVYTVSARGDMTVTSSTATNRPFLDNTANR